MRLFSLALLSAFLALPISAHAEHQPASSVILSDLIDGPSVVAPGELFKVKITGDLPYKISPEPASIDEVIDRKGNLLLLIVAGKPGDFTILVDYAVIHPTEAELQAAPLDDKAKFIKWMAEHAKDEIYRDSHTVKAGTGPSPVPPGPGPQPVPPNPPDDLTAKVKEWHTTIISPRKGVETKALSELYLTLASKVAAGGITDDDTLAEEMTKGHVTNLGSNARHWVSFIQSLGNTLNATPGGIKERGKVFESVGNALKAL